MGGGRAKSPSLLNYQMGRQMSLLGTGHMRCDSPVQWPAVAWSVPRNCLWPSFLQLCHLTAGPGQHVAQQIAAMGGMWAETFSPVLTIVRLQPDLSGPRTAKLAAHTVDTWEGHFQLCAGGQLMLLCSTAIPSLKDLQPPINSSPASQHPTQCRCCHLYLADGDHWGTERADCLFKVTVAEAVQGQSSGL